MISWISVKDKKPPLDIKILAFFYKYDDELIYKLSVMGTLTKSGLFFTADMGMARGDKMTHWSEINEPEQISVPTCAVAPCMINVSFL